MMRIDTQKLEIALARKCMSQSDLCQLGISSKTNSKIRRGDSITTKSAGRIAKALEVDITELLQTEKE